MKKTLAFAMALVTAFGMTAFADPITETSQQKYQTLTVSLETECTYSVTIPATPVVFGSSASGTTQDLKVTKASLNKKENHHLTVTVTSNNYSGGWRMKEKDSDYYLAYTISNVTGNETPVIDLTADQCTDLVTNKSDAEKTLTFACTTTDAPIAGSYSDTLTFTVACEAPSVD